MSNMIPFHARVEKSAEKCESNRTRGYAKLMSDAGQHGLAERLMDDAKPASLTAIEDRLDHAENNGRLSPAYVAEATAAIRQAVCEHMPTTAAANGMLSDPLPTRADAAAILDGPQGAAVERFVGLTGVMRSLSSLGLPCDKATARAVREEMIRRDLAGANMGEPLPPRGVLGTLVKPGAVPCG